MEAARNRRAGITPMTILSVAFPSAPVGFDTAGGAEQVVAMLDRAIVRAGHRSIVQARQDSTVEGTLHTGTADQALRRFPIDLVHMHGVDFHRRLPRTSKPVLVTLHLPREFYPADMPQEPNLLYHCVSSSQRRTWSGLNLLPDIGNGVPVQQFTFRSSKRSLALALGRICPEKGFHLAIDAAKRAAIPLILAGQVFPYVEHERYYRREIAPRLDARRRFIGPLGFVRKRRWLAAARCLLIPSLVAETSSLAAMEALASGTAVIAFRSGALSEIVEHGRTGFLVDTSQEMADAIRHAHTIDPAACRRAAVQRFAADRMTRRYLELYEAILGP